MVDEGVDVNPRGNLLRSSGDGPAQGRHAPVRTVAFVGQPEYFRCMYEHDLDAHYEVREFVLGWHEDVRYYRSLIKFDPDVAFFFRPECYPSGLIEMLSGIKVALSSEPIPKHIMGHFLDSPDMWSRFESLTGAKNRFDFFFHYDKTSLRFLRERGFQVNGEFLFPVATGLYRPLQCEKQWDWGFFGRDTPHRDSYLGVAKRDFNGLHVAHGLFGEEFVRLMSQCKIGVNIHVDGNLSLEHRVHNMMACGAMVMSEPLSHNDVLKPATHYVEFSEPKEFLEKLEYYLDHDAERERIAARGVELVREQLCAEKAFTRLIQHVTTAERSEEPFHSRGPAPAKPAEVEASPSFSFVRLNGILSDYRPRQRGWVTRWRTAVDRLMPAGTRRRGAYSRLVSTVKRRLGDKSRPLADTVRAWWCGAEPEAPAGKESLRKIVAASAARLNLPADAPTILIVLPSQSISGGTMVICEHANRLVDRGYNVLLVDNLLAGPDRYRLDWFPDLKPSVVPMSRIHFDRFVDAAMATHWTTAYAAIEMPAHWRLYFVQSDETRFNPPESVESLLAEETYRMPFEFLTIARWLQRWLKDGFGQSSQYIPNGVNEGLFYPDQPLQPKRKKLRVLLEGPIAVPFKGMEDAFRAVQDLECEVWCVSSQGKPRRGWKCDRFFHRVPFGKMRRIYSSCDVLLKMSRIEGFFMPPLEMMACGGTVVTGKVTGHDEYITDGYNGLVVEQGDVEGVRGAVQRLIDDRVLLEELKSHGRLTADQWRWDRSNGTFHEYLSQCSTRTEGASERAAKAGDALAAALPTLPVPVATRPLRRTA